MIIEEDQPNAAVVFIGIISLGVEQHRCAPSPPDGKALLGIGARGRGSRRASGGIDGRLLLFLGAFQFLGARLPVEEAALLDRAAGLHAAVVLVGVQEVADPVGAVDRARQVGYVLGHRVLAAHRAGIDAVALAGLAHGIVAAVKVLSLLEVLGEVVAAAGQLAVQPEEPLLLGRE